LEELDWDSLEKLTRDPTTGAMRPLDLPPYLSENQRRALEQSAEVRCPFRAPGPGITGHTLPYEYGRHGRPVILGLVGQTDSGKTHLLSTLVKALDESEVTRYVEAATLPLADALAGRVGAAQARKNYEVGCYPVDRQRHRVVLDDLVRSLFARRIELAPTVASFTSFTDAFVISQGGRSRTVAIFDVAGGVLADVQAEKRFLFLADGLLFTADATAMDVQGAGLLGERAFGNVLDLLGYLGRSGDVAAAIALTKGDLLRFEEPLDFWMRRPVSLDNADLVEETRDLYAFMHSRRAYSWMRPVTECGRTTLHAVSATGGSSTSADPGADGRGQRIFPRGIAPKRVLGPLLALLAMTGVIEVPDGDRIGVLR
jgi:hypothetical protein